jgi:chromosome segregation ATPase
MVGGMESKEIVGEIEGLERELETLRTRVAEDAESCSALENQMAELRQRLAETQDAVRESEARLAEKQAELEQAEHLERLIAYEEDVTRYRAAGGRVAAEATAFLAELDAYDGEVLRLRKKRDELIAAFGVDERVEDIERALEDEESKLSASWRAVFGAVKWRTEAPDLARATDEPAAHPQLSQDLHERAEESRASRILEYFNKS